MTVREMIALAQIELGQTEKSRFKIGVATSDGAADGTSIVASAFGGVDDGWNEAEVRITSGDALEERRKIGVYVTSSGTITLVEGFSHTIANGVTFEVGEAGLVSAHQLLKWFSQAQAVLTNMLVADAIPSKTKEFSVAATAGVSAAMPADLVGAPISVTFKDAVELTIHDVALFPPSKQDIFNESVIQGQDNDDMIAVFKNGVIHYRPNNNGTLLLEGQQKLADITLSGGSNLPAYLHHIQVKYAVIMGWNVKNRADSAQIVQNQFDKEILGINSKHIDQTKRSKRSADK